MADSRDPRPSTDEETAPLLQNVSSPDDTRGPPESPSFTERLSSAVHEPLSPLTKVLFVLLLLLLLLSSVFIGLFAGAQHKLNQGHGGGGDNEKSPVTVTTTQILTGTITRPGSSIAITTTAVTTTAITTTAITTTAITTTAVTTTTAISATTTVATTTVAVPAPIPTTAPEEKTCFSPQCVMLAASVISSLDQSYDPCENFYDFATGGWIKQHPIPSDKGIYGNFEALAQQNKRLIQQILSQDSSSTFSTVALIDDHEDPYDAQILKKLRGLYSSCMNEDLLEARGQEPLLHVIRNLRKLFSGDSISIEGILEERFIADDVHSKYDGENDGRGKEKEKQGLTAALSYLHSTGIGGLFDTDIEGDVGDDPNSMVLWFSQPKLGLPSKEYYEEESIVELYRNVLERLLVALADEEDDVSRLQTNPALAVHEERLRVWPPRPWPPWDPEDPDKPGKDKPTNRTKEAPKLAKQIIALEKRIVDASLDLDILLQDPIATYNPVPLLNLTDALPEIAWSTYFSTFTPRHYPERVILTSTTYPASLSSILQETDRDTLEAYLETRAALALSLHLGTTTEAWRATRVLEERLRGIKPGAVGDRAEYCVGRVEGAMGFAIGRYFVKEVFGGDSREKSTKVITDIIDAFKRSLSHIGWMDKESAKAAAEKADAIRVKVGFPISPDTRDPRSIAVYYNLVKVQKTMFFENMLSASTSDVYKKWQKLGMQRDPESWEMYPSMVNAYISFPANEIFFPAGILQPPFFSQHWPGYMSYGSFGQVAAHELTHAFDSAGRLYNQHGKLEQWWTNFTSDGFKKVQTCIVDQYSSYTIDDGHGGKIHVNGNLTSGENIGDTGLIQAYRAWKEQVDVSDAAAREYLLPGLDFTREQLFFISFARAWAQNIKPEAAVARIRTDSHSPNRYRVDGTVSNIPEFAQAFKCSPKAKLNPPQDKRCIFW
ncbi:uncharacterized protein PHACADRAFT_256119 [Phanerochaete carnosa HHB-10118-sp]|uniref:Endothelin-converting enzyme 1 n=1 Tax=Phanerochaete carnosa (strain HHB-10118-sp) TaxID=650164 RepID=K5UZ79_PHACS|nr:uncharacterized protein PHACADRAFT_256119 [Phanerochaete carnosa HHB-10118-sp]EKM55471.1 hypothetical protein PHACADRAFT_256119 [Phanerochaete carnosa HHB-10118-sp]